MKIICRLSPSPASGPMAAAKSEVWRDGQSTNTSMPFSSTCAVLCHLLVQFQVLLKVVIIVNDFGKIGIDGTVMKKYGLEVQDMPSGCICCTLGTDFLETVNTVASNFKPDLILVEPTGIADPANMIDTMKMYRGPKGRMRSASLWSWTWSRFPLILKALAVPLRNQLNAADLIVINKIDESGPEAIELVKTSLEGLGIRKRTISASAVTGENLDQVVEAMVGA